MFRINPEYLEPDDSDRSVTADLFLRQKSDKDENEEEDEDKGDGKEDNDEEDDGGYSVRVCRLCQW